MGLCFNHHAVQGIVVNFWEVSTMGTTTRAFYLTHQSNFVQISIQSRDEIINIGSRVHEADRLAESQGEDNIMCIYTF